MQVYVKLGEPLWRAVGARRLVLEWPAGQRVTAGDVLQRLVAEHSDFAAAYQGQGMAPVYPYRIFVDSRPVYPPFPPSVAGVSEPAAPALVDGQTLFIMLPAIGG